MNTCINCTYWKQKTGHIVYLKYRYKTGNKCIIETWLDISKDKRCKGKAPKGTKTIKRKDFGTIKFDFGSCTCKKFIYDNCEHKILTNKYINDALYYYDCEAWGADFETGKNFGCIHFKSKD